MTPRGDALTGAAVRGHDAAPCAARRQRVLELLQSPAAGPVPIGSSALIVAAAPEVVVGPDTELRYLPDADLYWLTGFTEPDAVLVLAPAADTPVTLFVRDRDPERERWTGARAGVDAAREQVGADATFPIDRLAAELPKLVAGADRLFARPHSRRGAVDDAVRAALAAGLRSRARTGRGPHTLTDPSQLLGPLRRRKDAHEIALLREACRITAAGFSAALQALPGARGEWELEAALEHVFRSGGAMGPAFPSIVAAGANATVLHYIANDAPLAPDAAVLIDAGARYRMYCGDISRTFPVSGRFTPAQQDVYDVVDRAHAAGLAAAVNGSTVAGVHDAALRILVGGMIDLGLLEGTADEIIENEAHKPYYPHRTSHWIGLDVHDAGDYVTAPADGGDAAPVTLEEGMVLTVEPGFYIPADDERAPPELRGIGVRIEDTILITADGREVLTA